jgi:hypothetical protein
MESLPQEVVRRVPKRFCEASLTALILLTSTGCVATGWFAPPADAPPPPKGVPCQVVTTWNNQVVYTQDPANNGRTIPGLAGRVYLFGPKIDFPMTGDGSAVVDLYDLSHDQPVLLEQWRFDPENLSRLLRRDAIGWGYTLFLPWGTYRPDITRVQLKVCYQPPKGAPLYAEGSPLTLNTVADMRLQTRSVSPTDALTRRASPAPTPVQPNPPARAVATAGSSQPR